MTRGVVLAIDAMGGDRAPGIVLDGLERAAASDPDLRFLAYGDEARLAPLVKARAALAGRCELRHAPDVVAMDAKPSQAVRRGRDTSMWRAIEAVRDGQAEVAVSAGNTGALMAMALFCLRAAPGVERPAIAALWPARTPAGAAVALDMGADVRAEAEDLALYAAMGSEYARLRLGIARPRVGLLNIGVEETKGRPEIKEAAALLRARAEEPEAGFEYVGFVEGDGAFAGEADVIVTDGFTGNAALKSAEGAARLVGDYLREAFKANWLSRLGAFFAAPALRAFQRRVDPRRVNGGVFLGLNGLVVKSHGGTDGVGFAAAVALAATMAREGFAARISAEARRRGAPAAAKGGAS